MQGTPLISFASKSCPQQLMAFISTSPCYLTWRPRRATAPRKRVGFVSNPYKINRVRCSGSEETPSKESIRSSDIESPRPLSIVPPEGQLGLSSNERNGTPGAETLSSAPGIVQSTPDLDLRVLLAEFLATFIFVYISTNVGVMDTPLAMVYNAAAITAVAASFMCVSGAHLNPAVTLALAATNRVSVKRGAVFVVLQLAASALACYLATTLGSVTAFAARAAISSKGELVRAMFSEAMPMFIIVIVVFQTAIATDQEGGVGNKLAALYIGLTVLACTGTFTGIFNPAIAFGTQLMSGNRRPTSWLADLEKYTSSWVGQIKNLGLAGLIAYGIMNTLYYSATFSYMMFKIGWSSGASGLAQAWIVCWSLSQVTKPIRLGLSIAMAPFINKLLEMRKRHDPS